MSLLEGSARPLILALASVLFVDQISKRLVVRLVPERSVGWRWSVFSIRRVTVEDGGPSNRGHLCAAVAVLVLATLCGVLYLSLAAPGRGAILPVALGSAVGGAASNLLDRLRHRGIVDFIAVGFWPIFNLADVAIVGGVLFMISFPA